MGLLVVVLFLLTLGLLMLGATWGLNKAAERMVGDKHRLLQTITETGEVPASWRRRAVTWGSFRIGSAGTERAANADRLAWRRHVQELDRLVRYARTTSLVDSEDTRELLLEKLARVRAEWLAASAAGIDAGENHE